MHLKVKLGVEECDEVLRKLIKYELRLCKEILMSKDKKRKAFYDFYTPELAAALNTVLNHFSVPKKKK